MIEKIQKPGQGILKVDVQSSNRIKPGIFFGINNHFVITSQLNSATEALKIIDLNFRKSLEESKKIAESLMETK
jgi:hypothetical protein